MDKTHGPPSVPNDGANMKMLLKQTASIDELSIDTNLIRQPDDIQFSPASYRLLGHGTYLELEGDPDDTAKAFFEISKHHDRLVVHFYNSTNDCDIMHKHLEQIARQHLETKFVKVNVENDLKSSKALMYLEEKLGIQVMPTVIFIKDHKQVHHLRAFEELGGDDFSNFTLKQVLAVHGVLMLTDAEYARLKREDDAAVPEWGPSKSFDERSTTKSPAPFDLVEVPAATFAAVGAAVGGAAAPVGWGPLASFDYQTMTGKKNPSTPKNEPDPTILTESSVEWTASSFDDSVKKGRALETAAGVNVGAAAAAAAKSKPAGLFGRLRMMVRGTKTRTSPVDDGDSVGAVAKAKNEASYDDTRFSTTQEGKTSFDATKLPAATFAAIGATYMKLMPKKEARSMDDETTRMEDAAKPIFEDSGSTHPSKRATRFSLPAIITAITVFLASLPKWAIPASMVAALFVVAVTLPFVLSSGEVFGGGGTGYSKVINVAFVGNSMQYFNDFPRFMEVISEDHIVQNSVLHADATIVNLLQSGNGMLEKFNTDAARIGDDDSTLYDYGACTVHQLLFGYDRFLYYEWLYLNETTIQSDYTGAYDDGLNPCYEDADYLSYTSKQFRAKPPQWDYLVLNDNTRSPGLYESRQESLAKLKSSYSKWLNQTKAIPVFLDTHAYWTSFRNMSGLVDVPTFTSLTFEGYRQYAELLGSLLPTKRKPRIAPVGIAFLAVWEDDYDMWKKLFHYDEVHASPHGTFLTGCVMHYTLFGHMPSTSHALPESIATLFSRARRMQPTSQHRRAWPTRDEAIYLYNMAKKVVVDGHLPDSFVRYDNGNMYY
jgi:hypothetical protein